MARHGGSNNEGYHMRKLRSTTRILTGTKESLQTTVRGREEERNKRFQISHYHCTHRYSLTIC